MAVISALNAVVERLVSKTPERDSADTLRSVFDGATGLLTKDALVSTAAELRQRGEDVADAFAVLSIELDKNSLDAGALQNDLVITETAHRIRCAVRADDLTARTDVYQFVILMPGVSCEHTTRCIAERILTSLSQPIVVDGAQTFPLPTVGVAMSEGGSGEDFIHVLQRSVLALQQARASRCGVVHFYDDAVGAEIDRRGKVEIELRRAVANGELRVHYQPICDLSDMTISHVEALVRWQHPERGMVPPIEFIPVAEASGLIQSVGIWVLQQAVTDLQMLDGEGLGEVGITVNISPEQLKLPNAVEAIETTGHANARHRGRIALEVTEDAIIDERYQMTAKLQRLRQAGFLIFLDDFGTGNASIGRLRKLDLDVIKIDRSLIAHIDDNEEDLAIVRSILHLASSLKLSVIAEGVETQGCLDRLSQDGCRFAQGYYIAKPAPLGETIEFIRQWSHAHDFRKTGKRPA